MKIRVAAVFLMLLLPVQAFAVDGADSDKAGAATDVVGKMLDKSPAAASPTPPHDQADKLNGTAGTDGGAKAPAVVTSTVGGGIADVATGMEFVPIPGNCFQAGSASVNGNNKEQPDRKICLANFMIGKNDVTVGQFRRFTEATGYKTDAEKGNGCTVLNGTSWKKLAGASWRDPGFQQDDSHPVVCVSWNDAQALAAWMNTLGSGRYRLPTEAEWEYSCHGGKREEYCGGGTIDAVAWYRDNAGRMTHPVGQKQANGFGVYDMSGNVWQWVQDWYGSDYPTGGNNPQGPPSGSMRVNRGGGWSCTPTLVRAAYRYVNLPGGRNSNLGFRLVYTAK